MGKFTVEEKKGFRLRKYAKERTADLFIQLVKNLLLTELAVHICGGRNYAMAAALAAGYTLGFWVYDIYHYKKEWLDVDIKPESGGKTEN